MKYEYLLFAHDGEYKGAALTAKEAKQQVAVYSGYYRRQEAHCIRCDKWHTVGNPLTYTGEWKCQSCRDME